MTTKMGYYVISLDRKLDQVQFMLTFAHIYLQKKKTTNIRDKDSVVLHSRCRRRHGLHDCKPTDMWRTFRL